MEVITKEEKWDRRWARFNRFFGPMSIAMGMWFMTNGAEDSPFFHAISPFMVWSGIAMMVDYFKYKNETEWKKQH